jgi:hypothetical protein
VLPDAVAAESDASVLPKEMATDGPLGRLSSRVEPFTFSRRGEAVAEAVAVAEKKQAAAKKKQELIAARDEEDLKLRAIQETSDDWRRALEEIHLRPRSMKRYYERRRRQNKPTRLSPVVESEQNLMPVGPYEGEIDV